MKKSHTFYTALSIEESNPDIHKLLCIFSYVDSIEVEVTYNYVPCQPQTQTDPSWGAEVEIEETIVTAVYIESGACIAITETASKLLDTYIDEEKLEVACFEDADTWFLGEQV